MLVTTARNKHIDIGIAMRVFMAMLAVLFLLHGLAPLKAAADNTVAVAFYCKDRTTLISEAHITAGQSLSDAQAVPDVLIVGEDSQVPVLRELGSCFIGWADSDGVLCSMDEPLSEDVSLYAAYAELSADTSGAENVSVDVSQAFLLRADMQQAQDVCVKVEALSDAHELLQTTISQDGGTVCDCYRATFSFTVGSQVTLVKTGFGLVSMGLPVSKEDKTKVKAYWLGSDGSVKHSAVKNVSGGSILLNWSDYDVDSSANIAIATVSEDESEDGGDSGATDQDTSGSDSSGSEKGSSSKSGTASGSKSSKSKSGNSANSSSASNSSSGQSTYQSSSSGTHSSSWNSTWPRQNGAQVASNSKRSESDEPTRAVLDEASADNAESGTYSGNDALSSVAASQNDGGSRDAGVLYGASMLVIAAIACAAWWFALYRRKRGDSQES